jgi:hypothetical protein
MQDRKKRISYYLEEQRTSNKGKGQSKRNGHENSVSEPSKQAIDSRRRLQTEYRQSYREIAPF